MSEKQHEGPCEQEAIKQRRYHVPSTSLIKQTRRRFIRGLKKISTALGVYEDKTYKNIKSSGDTVQNPNDNISSIDHTISKFED